MPGCASPVGLLWAGSLVSPVTQVADRTAQRSVRRRSGRSGEFGPDRRCAIRVAARACARQRIPASRNPSRSPSNTAVGFADLVLRAQVLDHLVRVQDVERICRPSSPCVGRAIASLVAASSSWRWPAGEDCMTRSAAARFWIWDFSFCIDTTMPVGRWVIRTAESVVLTLWPPGPTSGERRSSARSPGCRCGRSCSTSWQHLDRAKDVWRRPWLSSARSAPGRWVPASTRASRTRRARHLEGCRLQRPASSRNDVSSTVVGSRAARPAQVHPNEHLAEVRGNSNRRPAPDPDRDDAGRGRRTRVSRVRTPPSSPQSW